MRQISLVKIFTASLLVLAIVGCGSKIKNTVQPTQALGTKHVVGAGGVVLHIDKESSLKNAFGKADVFGRTTDKGYSELRFVGIDSSGNKIFYRKDIDILTNETTMSRANVSRTYGNINTNVYGNRASTNYTATTVNPSSDYHMGIPSDIIQIKLPKNKNKIYFLGHTVTIINATSHSLEYKITK